MINIFILIPSRPTYHHNRTANKALKTLRAPTIVVIDAVKLADQQELATKKNILIK